MKTFVTGVNGQLGHDVVNELLRRGHEAVGSDVQTESNCPAPYVALDITDAQAVLRGLHFQKQYPRLSWCGRCAARCMTWRWICGPEAPPSAIGMESC